jgi:hypothetical protein
MLTVSAGVRRGCTLLVLGLMQRSGSQQAGQPLDNLFCGGFLKQTNVQVSEEMGDWHGMMHCHSEVKGKGTRGLAWQALPGCAGYHCRHRRSAAAVAAAMC